ncbi:hypothetical protein [Sapientia aquatica]|uniref:Uncharacterized protein n=1 Tax=Sapientia aquatica TaxID=1549640 RepID=A0A4R5W3P7_9BURK|nr:hypothetical protein [Sapientia aquatica]TDK66058.1 hypothetical protein E2I14_10735 [Sapientia aquatica]
MKNPEREWWYIVLVGGLTVFLHYKLLIAAEFNFGTNNIYQFVIGYLCLFAIGHLVALIIKPLILWRNLWINRSFKSAKN